MIENQKTSIKKAVPARRDPACFELRHAILIPAGTILRQDPEKNGVFTCPAAYGAFSIDQQNAAEQPATYKRVISA